MRTRRAWRPLSLYWRRRRRAPARILVRRAATPAIARVTWFPQFHLHFATHVTTSNRGGQALLPVLLRSIETRTGRVACPPPVLVQRQWTSLLASSLLMQRTASFATLTFHSASSKTGVDTRAVRALETRFSSLRSFFAAHRSVVRTVMTPAPERRLLVQPPLPGRERTLFHRRERNTLTSMSTTSTILSRPAELVYRSELRTRSELETRHSIASVAVRQSQAAPAAEARPAPPPPRPLEAIDLDRLTEDVIRRVERRVRIERERRGL